MSSIVDLAWTGWLVIIISRFTLIYGSVVFTAQKGKDMLRTIVVAVLVILIIALAGAAIGLGYNVFTERSASSDSAEATATVAATQPEQVAPTVDTLPQPPLVLFPTNTPVPATDTPEPTATPLPTNTPVAPTDTPVPPPTNTPAPVVVPPTNTPVPPPPAATVPPPAPPPSSANGISATFWNLQDRSQFTPGGLIWFEWTIVNSSGAPVPYGCIGAMPQKDGADRPNWFKTSWGGSPGDAVPPQGFSADDNIVLNEAGNYTLRLAISFDDHSVCSNGGGTYHTLSNAIPFTIR